MIVSMNLYVLLTLLCILKNVFTCDRDSLKEAHITNSTTWKPEFFSNVEIFCTKPYSEKT